MPLDVKDMARLWDMLDAARAIAGFIEGREQNDLVADRMLRNAVERNLEIIGEAARHVSEKAGTVFPVSRGHLLSDYGTSSPMNTAKFSTRKCGGSAYIDCPL